MLSNSRPRSLVNSETRHTGVEVDALLAAPDRTTWTGRRDHALLTLAIQTGLRVSELTGLTCDDVVLGRGAHVRCQGKGRKDRITPLTSQTAAVLRVWLRERHAEPADPLFAASLYSYHNHTPRSPACRERSPPKTTKSAKHEGRSSMMRHSHVATFSDLTSPLTCWWEQDLLWRQAGDHPGGWDCRHPQRRRAGSGPARRWVVFSAVSGLGGGVGLGGHGLEVALEGAEDVAVSPDLHYRLVVVAQCRGAVVVAAGPQQLLVG
jgi:hypothetical protein